MALGSAFVALGASGPGRQAFLFTGIAFLFISILMLVRARQQPPGE